MVVFLFVPCLLPLSHGVSACVVSSGKAAVSDRIAFNIPSQPLGAALEAYARIASRDVLYDGPMAEGRRASLVDGDYTPENALEILLAGTGLTADFKDSHFFVVSLPRTGKSIGDVASHRSLEHARYYAGLQARLRAAFCVARILPDQSRIAARLWIGQEGEVLQVKALSSTGDDALDRRLQNVLCKLSPGVPPVGFAQPVTIAIMPTSSDAEQDCDGARRSPGRGKL